MSTNDALVQTLEQERLAIWNACSTDHERYNAWENRKATLLSYLLNDPATPRSLSNTATGTSPALEYPQQLPMSSLQSSMITIQPFQHDTRQYTTSPQAGNDFEPSNVQVYDPAAYVSRLPRFHQPNPPFEHGTYSNQERDAKLSYTVAPLESNAVPGTQMMTPSTSKGSQCSIPPVATDQDMSRQVSIDTSKLEQLAFAAPANGPILADPFAGPLEPLSSVQALSHTTTTSYTNGVMSGTDIRPHDAVDMTRTDTIATLSSVDEHNVKRRRKHIDNGKQSIAPRRKSEGSADGSGTPSRRVIPGSASAHKEAISKARYSRPAHPKLYCNKCDEYPNGFRGDHELRRHYDRAHAELRKVWICVEPARPSKEGWWPTKPVATCKQCKHQKHYNVYYNAAAHLRRAHFCPRKRGRRPKGEERESRAGKAGGDWPPIDWLKANGWLKEIEVSSSQYYPAPAQTHQPDDHLYPDAGYAYPTPPVDIGYTFSSPVAPAMEHTVSAPAYPSQHQQWYQDQPHLYQNSHFGIPINTPYAP